MDWVIVELRRSSDPTEIASAQACLLRRNGAIHRPDELAAPEFLVEQEAYFISVRHRNHLGIITFSALLLNQSSPVLLDFSDGSTPVNGGSNALKLNGTKLALWPGDVRFNRNVQYAGLYPVMSERGEPVTPTRKLKRALMIERFRDLVDGPYALGCLEFP